MSTPNSTPQTVTTHTREGDLMRVETITIKTQRATVEFSEILESLTIETDDADIFDNDVLKHERRDIVNELDQSGADVYQMRAYCNAGDRPRAFIIELDEDMSAANFAWYRHNGASKQVAAECTASQDRANIDAIKEAYKDGSTYFIALNFMGYHQSCGAIDDYNYATGDAAEELARELAAEMQGDGYTVNGIPEREQVKRFSLLNCQNWQGTETREDAARAIRRRARRVASMISRQNTRARERRAMNY